MLSTLTHNTLTHTHTHLSVDGERDAEIFIGNHRIHGVRSTYSIYRAYRPTGPPTGYCFQYSHNTELFIWANINSNDCSQYIVYIHMICELRIHRCILFRFWFICPIENVQITHQPSVTHYLPITHWTLSSSSTSSLSSSRPLTHKPYVCVC